MAIVSIPNVFTVGATIVASQHNSNFSTIYSDYNGNITDANISGSAAISNSKLAQITTAGKVSGAALTSLSSIPSGAGAIPLLNLSSACSVVQDTYAMNTASGNQTISGAGFTPTKVIILAVVDNTSAASWGFDDATTHAGFYDSAFGTTSTVYGTMTSASIGLYTTSATVNQVGYVSSFNSDGCVITWTRSVSVPAGTANLTFMFFK